METHNVCKEKLEELGDKAPCCECTGHKCKTATLETLCDLVCPNCGNECQRRIEAKRLGLEMHKEGGLKMLELIAREMGWEESEEHFRLKFLNSLNG